MVVLQEMGRKQSECGFLSVLVVESRAENPLSVAPKSAYLIAADGTV